MTGITPSDHPTSIPERPEFGLARADLGLRESIAQDVDGTSSVTMPMAVRGTRFARQVTARSR
jgi:hypothetical protein